MNKAVLVAVALVGSMTLTCTQRNHRDCPRGSSLMDACDEYKVCAWNKCTCPGKHGCHLICTRNPYKLCYGLKNGDSCFTGDYTCVPCSSGKLVCLDDDLIDGSGSGPYGNKKY